MVQREARWVTIREFPNYELSSDGEVFNTRSQRMLQVCPNNFGHVRVTLVDFDGQMYTRGVALMVAEAFVKPPNVLCDRVIVLNGDLSDVRAENLAWRPDGLAWKYSHQLKVPQPDNYYNIPIRNIKTGARYKSIIEAGMTEGLVFKDIEISLIQGWEVFPEGAVFEVIE